MYVKEKKTHFEWARLILILMHFHLIFEKTNIFVFFPFESSSLLWVLKVVLYIEKKKPKNCFEWTLNNHQKIN